MSFKARSRSSQPQLEAFNRRSGPSPVVCRALDLIYTGYLAPKGGLTVVGGENLPREGSYITAPSHTSALDTAAVGKATIDTTGRNTHFMAKPEYWRGITGRLMEYGGAFPIGRGSSFAEQPEVRARLDSIFSNDEALTIYPQGTRSESISRLKLGVGILAIRYGVPVIPAGIAGTRERSHAVIVFGEAMRTEQVNFDLGDQKAIDEIYDQASTFTEDLSVSIQTLRLEAEARRTSKLSW